MSIINYIILLAVFCITPAGVIWLCRRYSLLGKLGPIMVLYAIGMVVGNLPFIPDEVTAVQDILPNVPDISHFITELFSLLKRYYDMK